MDSRRSVLPSKKVIRGADKVRDLRQTGGYTVTGGSRGEPITANSPVSEGILARRVPEQVTILGSVVSQMKAALLTLGQCVDRCPDDQWHASHDDAPFSQVVFHTLFFTDYYLCRRPEGLRSQSFHLEHVPEFRDYEELEWKEPEQTYDREFCVEYLRFCLEKSDAILQEKEDTLLEACGFENRPISRLELYIYVTRHIQHHAAQLGLRLQYIDGEELQWIADGSSSSI